MIKLNGADQHTNTVFKPGWCSKMVDWVEQQNFLRQFSVLSIIGLTR